MIPASAQQPLHQQMMITASQSHVGGHLALAENPRDRMRGFSYWGYFYFYFTNPSPFNAERTVMPG
jgi:hypothetical protein